LVPGWASPRIAPIPLIAPLQGVEFWAVNTDAQALENHQSLNKLQIGTTLTRGLGERFPPLPMEPLPAL